MAQSATVSEYVDMVSAAGYTARDAHVQALQTVISQGARFTVERVYPADDGYVALRFVVDVDDVLSQKDADDLHKSLRGWGSPCADFAWESCVQVPESLTLVVSR